MESLGVCKNRLRKSLSLFWWIPFRRSTPSWLRIVIFVFYKSLFILRIVLAFLTSFIEIHKIFLLYSSNLNVHTSHFMMLLKCWFWFMNCKLGVVLCFWQGSRWCQFGGPHFEQQSFRAVVLTGVYQDYLGGLFTSRLLGTAGSLIQ